MIFEVFAKSMFLQLSSVLASKNLPKTLPKKRSPNPSKIDAENDLFLNIDFVPSWPPFWEGLGAQVGFKIGPNGDFVSKKFKAYLRQLNIKDAQFHDLRRTFGLNLIKSGVPIYTVSKLLGHSSVRITEEHYAPLLISDIEEFELPTGS